MNADKINENLKYYKSTPSPVACIRQACLLCKDDPDVDKMVCNLFECPLWLYRAEDGFETDDFYQRIHITISTCREIHESK